MSIERHAISSRDQWLNLRRKDITASVAAALVGEHPYETRYGLWAEKTGRAPRPEEANDAQERGLLLEGPVVEVLRQRRPDWRVTRAHQYFRDPEARLGCTPDAYADCPERGRGLVQIKTVESSAFRSVWLGDAGEVVPPLWIAIQAIVEAHLTGRAWAAVAALEVGWRLNLHVVDIPIHAGAIERIRTEVRGFWRMVDAGEQPQPDYARDADAIARVYRDVAEGEVRDLTGDNEMPALLDERDRLTAEKGAAEKRLKEIKAELLFKLGSAEAGRCADGRLVTARIVHRKPYSVEASSYRDLRVKAAPLHQGASL